MFINMKALINSSLTGHFISVHKLSPLHLQIYLVTYSLCYKGTRIKSMRQISYAYIGSFIKSRYGIEVTKRQIKYGMDKIVSLGLVERITTNFVRNVNGQLLPDKASYYRLPLSQT